MVALASLSPIISWQRPEVAFAVGLLQSALSFSTGLVRVSYAFILTPTWRWRKLCSPDRCADHGTLEPLELRACKRSALRLRIAACEGRPLINCVLAKYYGCNTAAEAVVLVVCSCEPKRTQYLGKTVLHPCVHVLTTNEHKSSSHASKLCRASTGFHQRRTDFNAFK